MASREYITLEDCDCSGEVMTHAAGDPGGNYATLCGCSSDDDMMRAIETPRGQKINCKMCLMTFKLARTFRITDFEPE